METAGLKERARLLKLLVEEASLNSSIEARFNRTLGIVNDHQAIEWTLRAVIQVKCYFPTSEQKSEALERPYSALVQTCKQGLRNNNRLKNYDACMSVLDKYSFLVQRLGEARNSIYHDAIVDIEAAELVGGVIEMLAEVFDVILEIKWSEISLLQELRNSKWRTDAENIEQLIAISDYRISVNSAWNLMQDVLGEFGTIAAEIGRGWLEPQFGQHYEIIREITDPERYARKYDSPEIRSLALDISRGLYLAHFLTDTLTLLDEKERIQYLKLLRVIK